MSMVWPTLGSRKAKERNRTDPDHARLGVVCHTKVNALYAYLYTKFEDSIFSHSSDMKGDSNHKKWCNLGCLL